jgi:hypothetical protein
VPIDGGVDSCTYVNVFPTTTLNICQFLHGHNSTSGEVSSLDLGIDLDAAIGWYHIIRDGDTLMDRNSLIDDGVVLHATLLSATSHR